VLDELESQNDAQVEGIMGKVKMLKEVSFISGRIKRERMEVG
jgi:blocked-early-in-transport protein 1